MFKKLIALAAFALAAIAPQAAMAQEEGIAPLQVAVIDNGVKKAEHLQGVLGTSWDMLADRKDKGIKSEHGTHVASIIAANVTRPIVIHSFRADIRCRRNEPCELSANAIAAAIRSAMGMNVDLIQISIEGKLGDKAIEAIRRATEAGIQVVISAGNTGLRSHTADAASGLGPNVHIVGALDENGERADFTAWSRRDDVQLVMRPGVNVPATNSAGRIERVTGTSFAAPLYAAELLEAMPRKPISNLAMSQ